jgi:hypothetical protein
MSPRLALLLLFLWISFCPPAVAAFDQKHTLWTGELKKYSEGPLVHYRRWKQKPEILNKYIGTLAGLSSDDYKAFSVNQKKALWINTYNAMAVKIVVDHYPIIGNKSYYPPKSIRQIPDVWEQFHFKVAGKDLNLYGVEHNVIRKDFSDPRMHFAVVCASKGCPCLKKSAYVADTLEQDLDAATRAYLMDPKNVTYDPQKNVLKVSQMFKWFPLDFAANAGYTKTQFPPPNDDDIVLNYISATIPEYKQKLMNKPVQVEYLPYDWSLNDADEPGAMTALKTRQSCCP